MKAAVVLSLLALIVVPQTFAQEMAEPGMSSVKFRVYASPSKEAPPVVGAMEMADAVIEFNMHRDEMGEVDMAIVDYRVNYTLGTPQRIRAMHIHEAPPGISGPVVIDGGFGPAADVPAGSGSFFRHVVVDDSMGLEKVMEVIENPGQFYFNVHTDSNPPGHVRGQLMPYDMTEEPLRRTEEKVDAVHADLAALEEQVTEIDRFLSIMANSLGITIANLN